MREPLSEQKSKSAQLLSRLAAHLPRLPGELKAQVESPGRRADLGAEALLRIHQEAGDAGITAFAEWAIHSATGILPQSTRLKPLPEPVRKALEPFIAEVNARADALAANPARLQHIDTTAREQSRRQFMQVGKCALSIAAGTGVINLASNATTPLSIGERLDKLARALLVGGFIGAAMEVVLPRERVNGWADDEAMMRAGTLKRTEPGEYRLDLDRAAAAAARTLERQIAPETGRDTER